MVLDEPHASEPDAVIALLGASAQVGISESEAADRLARYGLNVLDGTPEPSRLELIARQLTNLPSGLLLGSAAASLAFGAFFDAGAILTVLGLNAAIAYRMERTSAQLLEAWRQAEAGSAEVIRDGHPQIIGVPDLVVGDLWLVRAGNVVPADARIVDAHRLLVDEAPLTGESEPVAKTTTAVAATAALAERTCMLYRGTRVVGGHGRALIIAIGDSTELGNVRRLASAARSPKPPLARQLEALATRLAWSGLIASGISAIASLAWRRPWIEISRDTVALGVAAIPEGLPVTSSAALVRAMARMREHGIVVRRLATAETLGAITVACADKTGTLTENQMGLEEIWIDGTRIVAREIAAPEGSPPMGPVAGLLAAAVLNSDLDYHVNGGAVHVAGSSTEGAIARAAIDAGLDPVALRARYPRQQLIERDDGARYVMSEHRCPDGTTIVLAKGAPEQLVAMCAPPDPLQVIAENRRMASRGLRVLAVASGDGHGRWWLLGMVALRDPLRAGAAEAIRGAADAGIRTVILTGDQKATAAAIARDVGLRGEVVEADELRAVLEKPERLRTVSVFARVTPDDKVAVIEALRAAGEIVAMAGDGINDAPALRAADVGIAVGARSTDLARQTADVVLEREDLRSILAAISEGRIVQDNLRRSIQFQIAGNLGELLLITVGALAGRRVISPLGLLWINLITDTLPGLALALEAGNPDVLARPPAQPGAPLIDRRGWKRIARDGAAIAGASGLAAIAGGPLAAFATIGAAQFGYAATCRAPDRLHADRRFARLIGMSAVIHFAAVASSPFRRALQLRGPLPLAFGSFALAIGIPLVLATRARNRFEITRVGIRRAKAQ